MKVLDLYLSWNEFEIFSNLSLKKKLIAKMLNLDLKKKLIAKVLKKMGTNVAN